MARRSRAWWTKVISEFEQSGLSQKEFCARRGLVLGSFQSWLYRIRGERSGSSLALVRVEPAAPAATPLPVEAALPSGVVLRFASSTDPRYVAALVAEVENARC